MCKCNKLITFIVKLKPTFMEQTPFLPMVHYMGFPSCFHDKWIKCFRLVSRNTYKKLHDKTNNYQTKASFRQTKRRYICELSRPQPQSPLFFRQRVPLKTLFYAGTTKSSVSFASAVTILGANTPVNSQVPRAHYECIRFCYVPTPIGTLKPGQTQVKLLCSASRL